MSWYRDDDGKIITDEEFIKILIDRLKEEKKYCSYHPHTRDEAINKAIKIVNELAEEYKGGWIPCSERLPKEKGFYIVTQEIYSFDGKRLLRTVTKADILFNPVNQKWNISDNLKVIAWQPLPPAYEEADK